MSKLPAPTPDREYPSEEYPYTLYWELKKTGQQMTHDYQYLSQAAKAANRILECSGVMEVDRVQMVQRPDDGSMKYYTYTKSRGQIVVVEVK